MVLVAHSIAILMAGRPVMYPSTTKRGRRSHLARSDATTCDLLAGTVVWGDAVHEVWSELRRHWSCWKPCELLHW
jgi:hypothetical protein